jgi:hypothetical protein
MADNLDKILFAPVSEQAQALASSEQEPDSEAGDLVEMLAGLDPRELRFVAEYVKHGIAARAARDAGFPKSYNPLARSRKLRAAMAQVQRSVATRLGYSVKASMQELAEAMTFAKTTENAMALVRAIETRAKIAGHMQPDNQMSMPNLTINIDGVQPPRYVIEGKAQDMTEAG